MVGKWLVVFAVDDLKSIPCSFKILDVSFDKFNESNWRFCKNTNLKQRVLPRFLGKNCAYTEIEADTDDEAFEKGNKKIETSLNVLRTYKSGFELRRPLNGVAKNLNSGEEEITLEASWHRNQCSPWKYALNQIELNALMKNMTVLERLLAGSTHTAMGKRISRSLRWASMATQETEMSDKILKYTTALECLLIKEQMGKARRIAERVAIFWTNNHDNRNEIFRNVHTLYNLRNNIIHGEDFIVTESDEKTMDHVARELVFAVANELSKNSLSTFDEFLRWLEIKKGTWNPPKIKE